MKLYALYNPRLKSFLAIRQDGSQHWLTPVTRVERLVWMTADYNHAKHMRTHLGYGTADMPNNNYASDDLKVVEFAEVHS